MNTASRARMPRNALGNRAGPSDLSFGLVTFFLDLTVEAISFRRFAAVIRDYRTSAATEILPEKSINVR